MNNALGMLETLGLTAVIAGTDAMVKAANVEVLGTERIGAAHVAVLVRGDVASVKAAIDAGAEAAAQHGKVVSVNVIASPDAATDKLVGHAAPAVVE